MIKTQSSKIFFSVAERLRSNFIFALLLSLSFISCESTKSARLTWDENQLQGKTIAVSKRPMPQFWIDTAANTNFGGFVGASAKVKEGEAILRTNTIADPSDMIEASLIVDLVRMYPLSIVSSGPNVEGKVIWKTSKDVVTGYSNSDYVLDLNSYHFFVSSGAQFTDSSALNYTVLANIIDVSSKKSVSRSTCKYLTDTSIKRYSKSDFVASGATILKAEIDLAIRQCVAQFKADLIAK